ncbi:DUF6634 family protein [Tianweitania sp.]|uniref:DUF6634 family protein n=1 Tax=Tianweitania sp. TaxID=2021634 RepID=UPI0028993339|nr:DUF6634 family protein [Tianweitania sp.]
MVTFKLLSQEHNERFSYELAKLSMLVADIKAVQRGVHPSHLCEETVPVLDRWILTQRGTPCLAGLSSGHPTLLGDTRPITTSDLWLLSEDQTWARTFSRWYQLGRPVGHNRSHS